MGKLSIPFTKDSKILSLVKEHHLEYIEEIYMPVPGDIIGSARSYTELEAEKYRTELESHVESAKSKGIKVSFIANKQFVDHSALKKTSIKLCRFLKEMKDKYDIDKVIISNLYIIRQYGKFIADMGIEIELSVLVGINSVEAFEQIIGTVPYISSVCLGDYFIHDIEALRYIKKTHPNIVLKIIPNHGCFVNCASEQQHHNYSSCTFSSDAGSLSSCACNSELGLASNLCATCRSDYGLNRLLSNVSFIRPSDLKLYDNTIDIFKISGREHRAEDIIRVIEAYGTESYSGQLGLLLDLNIGISEDVKCGSLPDDIGIKRSNCNHKCYKCHYCEMIDNFKKSHIVSDNIEV